jgi:hypothetical protein
VIEKHGKIVLTEEHGVQITDLNFRDMSEIEAALFELAWAKEQIENAQKELRKQR